MSAPQRHKVARLLRRVRNGVRKLARGLTLFGENISPEIPNDLYVAHLSIYTFAGGYARDCRVLDIGCGAGYGSQHLLERGSNAVAGVDIDRRNVRYASKRFRDPRLTFVQADAADRHGQFDLIVASNVLEHLDDVVPALDAARAMLQAGGRFIVAVPPIADDASLLANEAIPYHRSNLMITRWYELLSERFEEVKPFRHDVRAGVHPDFTDPFPSRLSADDFVFEEIDPAALTARPTITAIFVCRRLS